jgi:hypothetical protein
MIKNNEKLIEYAKEKIPTQCLSMKNSIIYRFINMETALLKAWKMIGKPKSKNTFVNRARD